MPSHGLHSDYFLFQSTLFGEINITQDICIVLQLFFLSGVHICEKN